MADKLTIWTRRRVKFIVVGFIIFGVSSFAVFNIFFPSFFYEHLAFCVTLAFQPFVTAIFWFFFVTDPKLVPDRSIKVLESFGYNISEEVKEECKRKESRYNSIFVPIMLGYSFIWLAQVYILEAMNVRLLGDTIDKWIHVYGVITYAIPMLLVVLALTLYLARKYPNAREVEKLLRKVRLQDPKKFGEAIHEAVEEEKRK